MPRGGKRSGAGRPKGSRNKPRPDLIPVHSVIEVLRNWKFGRHWDFESRVVIALSLLHASDAEIAEVFRRPEPEIAVRFRDELELGRLHRDVAIKRMLMRAALGRGRPTSIAALLYVSRQMERDAKEARARR